MQETFICTAYFPRITVINPIHPFFFGRGTFPLQPSHKALEFPSACFRRAYGAQMISFAQRGLHVPPFLFENLYSDRDAS